MTRVTVEYAGAAIRRLSCEGHAGGAAEGENVVCAAVSALMQTCVNALERVAGLTPETIVDAQRALIAVAVPDTEGVEARDAQTLLRATVLGLTDIANEYPKLVKLKILNGRNQS
jgi:uncharacterized protein